MKLKSSKRNNGIMERWNDGMIKSRRDDMFVESSINPTIRTPLGVTYKIGTTSLSLLIFVLWASLFAFPFNALATGEQYVSFENVKGAFPLSVKGKSVPLYASAKDFPGVFLF